MRLTTHVHSKTDILAFPILDHHPGAGQILTLALHGRCILPAFQEKSAGPALCHGIIFIMLNSQTIDFMSHLKGNTSDHVTLLQNVVKIYALEA